MALAALLKRPLTYCVVAGALPDDLAPATQNSGSLSPHVPSAFRSSNIRLTAAYALVGSVKWGYSVGTFELQPGAFGSCSRTVRQKGEIWPVLGVGSIPD